MRLKIQPTTQISRRQKISLIHSTTPVQDRPTESILCHTPRSFFSQLPIHPPQSLIILIALSAIAETSPEHPPFNRLLPRVLNVSDRLGSRHNLSWMDSTLSPMCFANQCNIDCDSRPRKTPIGSISGLNLLFFTPSISSLVI